MFSESLGGVVGTGVVGGDTWSVRACKLVCGVFYQEGELDGTCGVIRPVGLIMVYLCVLLLFYLCSLFVPFNRVGVDSWLTVCYNPKYEQGTTITHH